MCILCLFFNSTRERTSHSRCWLDLRHLFVNSVRHCPSEKDTQIRSFSYLPFHTRAWSTNFFSYESQKLLSFVFLFIALVFSSWKSHSFRQMDAWIDRRNTLRPPSGTLASILNADSQELQRRSFVTVLPKKPHRYEIYRTFISKCVQEARAAQMHTNEYPLLAA